MTLKDYMALPKWKGKVFMQDEKTCFNDGYAEGCKENSLQWHDLRKDPNDLPPPEKNVLIHCLDYGMEFNTVGHRLGERYYSNLGSRVFDRVIKWAEISD